MSFWPFLFDLQDFTAKSPSGVATVNTDLNGKCTWLKYYTNGVFNINIDQRYTH